MLFTSEKRVFTSSTNSDLLKSGLKFDTLTRNTYTVIKWIEYNRPSRLQLDRQRLRSAAWLRHSCR